MSVPVMLENAEVIAEVLRDHGLQVPDGRPLHGYAPTESQLSLMARTLSLRVKIADERRQTAELFVLWAAEKIRREFRGGPLSWRFLFDALGASEDQALARSLTGTGLKAWRRAARRSDHGTQYLFSLMAEGGLPDALIAEAGRFRNEIVAMIAEIETEARDLPEARAAIVARRVGALPLVFQTEESQRLLGEFAVALIALRARLPGDLDEETLPAALAALNNWREALPVRLSPEALRELVAPALLTAPGARRDAQGALTRRQLRRAANGAGWVGALMIADQGLLPLERLPAECRDLRLRLLPSGALSAWREAFFAAPEPDGWRLSRSGRRGDALAPLHPWIPATLSAHADGRGAGEAILDGGIDAPSENPSFWKEIAAGTLEHLGPVGVVRGEAVWLLGPPGAMPVVSEGVTVSGPEPAPGGWLWRLSGQGQVALSGTGLTVRTGAEADARPRQLFPTGAPLRGWRDSAGWPTFIGQPRFFGGEADGTARTLPARTMARQPAGPLFGMTTAWVQDGAVQAKARTLELPDGFAARLSPAPGDGARLALAGLPAGLTVTLAAGADQAATTTGAGGEANLDLAPGGTLPAYLHLRLHDPVDGRSLSLEAPWPGRAAVFAAPDGSRLERERSVAIGSLPGWRGLFPTGGGVLQIRPDGAQERIAIAADGEISLSAQEPMLRALLAQCGPDEGLRLRLVAGGVDSVRLRLVRHEWQPELSGDVLAVGPSHVALHALPLDGSLDLVELTAESAIDLRAALGEAGDAVWFIQGRCPLRGVMRPVAWSAANHPRTTRGARIDAYSAEFDEMLANPADSRWRQLRRVLAGARAGGEVAGLDQVQTLARRPAAAVALVLRATRADLADTLAIEDSCAIWWPVSHVADWEAGFACDLARRTQANLDLGEDPQAAAQDAQGDLARRAHEILALRPELSGHLAAAFKAAGVLPFALDRDRTPVPLSVSAPTSAYDALAVELARRAPPVPQGASGVPTALETRAGRFDPGLRPFLDAPLICAEIALGRRPAADASLVLRLMALRLADPLFFDAALPAAIQIARAQA